MNKIQKRKSNFTTVSNSFLRDSNLSFKAKGLFCYMFSMTEDWNFTIKSIAKQQKDGEASVKSALDELKELGYITYSKHQDGTGTYFLDDVPNFENPNLENPNLENPNLGKSPRIKKEQPTKNNNSQNNNNIKEIKKENQFLNDLPDSINKESLKEWIDYKGKKYTKHVHAKVINFLFKYDYATQKQIIDTSIMNGWAGLFEPKQQSNNQHNPNGVNYNLSEQVHKESGEITGEW